VIIKKKKKNMVIIRGPISNIGDEQTVGGREAFWMRIILWPRILSISRTITGCEDILEFRIQISKCSDWED
jgi:hypothetical protein